MKKLFLLLSIYGMSILSYAQVSGNQVNSDDNDYYYRNSLNRMNNALNKLYINDSSFIIEAKILKNVKADCYIAVFSLKQEASSVKESNNKINLRLKSFINNIKKLGIEESEIYTDIITQTRVFDVKKSEMTKIDFTEYLKGFELSKNVIIKYNKPDQIEDLITFAAQDSIFDLAKVDYLINDISKIYDELFVVAKEVIQKKKKMYIELTEMKVKPNAQIYAESFSSYYPKDLYRGYKSAELKYFEDYQSERSVKKLSKFKTFYYDKIDYSSFDKIINPANTEPSIEVTLTIQVKYNIIK
ncbi:MAG: SIMPL domain-containing protein [Bacteroidota bacterium]